MHWYRRSRVVRYGLGSFIGAVAVIGVLHTPAGRPLTRMFAGLCPVNNVSAETVERAQAIASSRLRGSEPIPHRDTPALRLLFGGRPVLDRVITQKGSHCTTSQRGLLYVSCVPQPGRSDEREMLVSSDRGGTVRSVDLTGRTTSAAAAAAMAKSIAAHLTSQLGPAHTEDGEFTPSYLDAPFRSASSAYRFADVLITLRATNIPNRGILVEELYVRPGNDAGVTAEPALGS